MQALTRETRRLPERAPSRAFTCQIAASTTCTHFQSGRHSHYQISWATVFFSPRIGGTQRSNAIQLLQRRPEESAFWSVLQNLTSKALYNTALSNDQSNTAGQRYLRAMHLYKSEEFTVGLCAVPTIYCYCYRMRCATGSNSVYSMKCRDRHSLQIHTANVLPIQSSQSNHAASTRSQNRNACRRLSPLTTKLFCVDLGRMKVHSNCRCRSVYGMTSRVLSFLLWNNLWSFSISIHILNAHAIRRGDQSSLNHLSYYPIQPR